MFLFSLQLLIFAMNDNLISQIEGATLILTILLFIYFSLQRKEASVNDENFNIPKVSNLRYFLVDHFLDISICWF